MSSAAANYQESNHFIHQRYEDTAHNIFQHQQKLLQDEKRRQKQSNSHHKNSPAPSHSRQPDLHHYGNHGIADSDSGISSAHSQQSRFTQRSNNSALATGAATTSAQTPTATSTSSSRVTKDSGDTATTLSPSQRQVTSHVCILT